MKKLVSLVALAAIFLAGCGEPEVADSGSGSKSANGGDNFVNLDDAAGYAKVLFDFDKYDIRVDMQERINKGAEALKTSNAKVVLEGHTDSYGSDAYNYALGTKRANSVKKALIANGASESQMTTISYGESKPTCTDNSPDCHQENRRVEFKLSK